MGILTAFVNRWLQTLLLSVRASDIASELLLELSLLLLTFFLSRRTPCVWYHRCGRVRDPKS